MLPFCARADQQTEKWMDDKMARMTRADQYAETLIYPKKTQDIRAGKKKRWSFYGKVGSEFDSNVPLVSEHKSFRSGHTDTHAFTFPLNGNVSYDLYRSKKTRAGIAYGYSYFPHTGELQSYNFQNHEASLYANRAMKAWGRPAQLNVRYVFSYGVLDAKAYSSNNFFSGSWTGEWADNLLLTIYQRLGESNFRDKGFDKSISSRNGFYEQTGVSQTFLFDNRKRSITAGYELGIDATRGNNFDSIDNGVRIKLKSPLVEKVTGEAIFLFQDSYYQHFVEKPKRDDLQYQYEFRLSRPINQNIAVNVYYRRIDVETPHEGTLGQFSYARNLGGIEFTYAY
jgi:hypothetical protein